MNKGLKIAISGKGGVGKTTLAAALARIAGGEGFSVIAVDADPDANLAAAFGVSAEQASGITPIAQLKELIAERTGAEPGTTGGFFSLNPKVDDIPERYFLDIDGIKLMALGTVENAGAGCICPESALLRRLTQHLVLERRDVIILDMEAGIEHLGRATAQGVDALLVLVEPGRRSVGTAQTIARLAAGLGIKHVFAVMNKVMSAEQAHELRELIRPLPLLGVIDDDEELRHADLLGRPVWASEKFMDEARLVWAALRTAVMAPVDKLA